MPNPVVEIIITKNSSYATGIYFDDGSVKINQGSKVSPYVVPSASKSVLEWRKRIQNECLNESGIFIRNFTFPNYSSCVSAIVGRNDNADSIDTVDGIPLSKYLIEKEVRGPLSFSVTCRPDAYDVEGAFQNLDSVWWRQSVSRIRKNDYVYIYVAKPIQSYVYKCLVLNANVPEEQADLSKDAKYILDIAALPEKRMYMELKLLEIGNLPVEIIQKETEFNSFGLRKQFLLNDEVLKVFEKSFISRPSLADLDDEENIEYHYSVSETNSAPRKKVVGETEKYVRSAFERQKALDINGKQCQMPDCTHKLFKNKSGEPYLEVHHIIPINAQSDFDPINIDIAENMVCLCPSCHREIHNGQNSKDKIIEIFNSRKEKLERKGIVLSGGIDQLLNYYGIK